jgi:hypothetical protein
MEFFPVSFTGPEPNVSSRQEMAQDVKDGAGLNTENVRKNQKELDF